MNAPTNQARRRANKRDAQLNAVVIPDFVSIFQAFTVAEYASISRAARVLRVRPSAVSRRIQALEDDLGVSLFERQLDGVRPTIAGDRFFERTRAALAEIEQAIRNAAAAGRGAEGIIRVGVPPSACSDFLCDLLRTFRETHPDVSFEYFDWPSQKLIAGISLRRLDVAFTIEGTPAPGCDLEPLWSAGIRVVMPARHPLSGCDAIEWQLLKDEHFIFGREAAAAGLADHANKRISKFGGRVSLATHDVSQDLVMRLVSRGFGVSLVSGCSTEITYAGVAFRPVAGEDELISYCAAWLPGNDNPALRRFLSLARSMSSMRSSSKLERVSD